MRANWLVRLIRWYFMPAIERDAQARHQKCLANIKRMEDELAWEDVLAILADVIWKLECSRNRKRFPMSPLCDGYYRGSFPMMGNE